MSVWKKITHLFRSQMGDKFAIEILKQLRNKRILDIGCGENDFRNCIDKSNSMVLADIKRVGHVNHVCSVEDMDFEDGEFDFVICLNVLEHVKHPFNAVLELKRVLKPDGKILLGVPFIYPVHEAPNDFWRFTMYGIKEMFPEFNILKHYSTPHIGLGNYVLMERKKCQD